MLLGRQFYPVTSDDFRVGHEPNLEVDVRLEGGVGDVGEVLKVDLSLLKKPFGRSDQFRQREGDLDEGEHLVTLKIER